MLTLMMYIVKSGDSGDSLLLMSLFKFVLCLLFGLYCVNVIKKLIQVNICVNMLKIFHEKLHFFNCSTLMRSGIKINFLFH